MRGATTTLPLSSTSKTHELILLAIFVGRKRKSNSPLSIFVRVFSFTIRKKIKIIIADQRTRLYSIHKIMISIIIEWSKEGKRKKP